MVQGQADLLEYIHPLIHEFDTFDPKFYPALYDDSGNFKVDVKYKFDGQTYSNVSLSDAYMFTKNHHQCHYNFGCKIPSLGFPTIAPVISNLV